VRLLSRASAVLALICALGLVHTAGAGRPGRWDRITTPTQSGVAQIGVLRVGGTLHVVWQRRTGPNTDDLVHTPISSAGAPGAATTIVSGWSGVGDAALVPGPGGGLRLFFSGTRSTTPGEPLFGLNTATAPASGTPWTVAPASIATADFAHARTPAAALAPDGTPFQTWYSAGTTVVHRGLDPGTPDHEYPAPDGVSVRPNIVTDPSSGRMFVAWCTFTAASGVYLQQVDVASGAPAGTAQKLAGSTTTFEGQEYGTCNLEGTVAHRTALAARVGGGVYVATAAGYPSQTRVLVWRLTSAGALAQTIPVASAASVSHALVALAADPAGRIWVAWRQSGAAGTRVFARRSNRAGTTFGAVVSAPPPPGAAQLDVIDLAPQAGLTDVLARYSTVSSVDLWHSQLLPGLSMSTTRRRALERGEKQTVTFIVHDAGDPVGGARVSAAGKSATTNAAGRARLTITPAGRRVAVRATRAGWVAATLTLQAR
jgi:hypothetical protein